MNDDLLDTNNINHLLKDNNEEIIEENTPYDDFINNIQNENRRKYKKMVKTYINIDSRNRSIDSKISYLSTSVLSNNTIITKKAVIK